MILNSNTPYTTMTQDEATAGTSTAGRLITAKILSDTIDSKSGFAPHIITIPTGATSKNVKIYPISGKAIGAIIISLTYQPSYANYFSYGIYLMQTISNNSAGTLTALHASSPNQSAHCSATYYSTYVNLAISATQGIGTRCFVFDLLDTIASYSE